MSGDQPFIPVTGATSGKTVIVSAVSGASTPAVIDSTGGYASSILVTNLGATAGGVASSVTLFVRMSTEATPVATSTGDVPIPPNFGRVFENPNPVGKTGVAAIAPFGAVAVAFTPGNAGVE